MDDIRLHLGDLLSEVSIFPSNDPLVAIPYNKCIAYHEDDLPLTPLLKSILNESRFIERNKGVAVLCTTYGVYTYEVRGEKTKAPIFLQHVEPKLNKESKNYSFSRFGEAELNPFLKNLWLNNPNEQEITSIDDLKQKANGSSSFSVSESYIGNFDPKRFAFIREIKEITNSKEGLSNALVEIYGNESDYNSAIQTSESTLFPLDSGQEKLIHQINTESCLVQGPPGTGKSQLLANCLGQALQNKKSTLVISEKNAALHVICKKMTAMNLMGLCFQLPPKYSKRACIDSLKESWELLQSNLPTLEQQCFKKKNLNAKLFKAIAQTAEKEQCTVSEIVNILGVDNKPNIQNPKNLSLTVKDLSLIDPLWDVIPVGISSIITHLQKECLESEFNEVKEQVDLLYLRLKKLKNIKTWSETKAYLARSLTYHSYDSQQYQSYATIMDDHGVLFLKLYEEYTKLKRKTTRLQAHENHWVKPPNSDEITVLEEVFKENKSIRYLSYKWWKWKRYTRTPALRPLEQIKKRKTFLKAISCLYNSSEKIHKLGIQDIERELPIILKLIKSIDFSLWSDYRSQTTQKKHKEIYNCLIVMRSYFIFQEKDEPLKFLSEFKDKIETLQQHWETLRQSPDSLRTCWGNHKSEIELKSRAIIKQRILEEHPSLSNFSAAVFLENIKEINKIFNSEAKKLSQNILNVWTDSFHDLEILTRTDPRKLNQLQKDFRKKLKKGKAILTKEFSKKRNHKPIRELLLSEARPWIDVLKPIWLGNPSLLADHLPMEKEMFDFVISDESSQLLLSHSIGAFQRGSKSIICGDPEQMSPSSYFKKRQSSEMSLLHHAFYHLNRVFLSNHYRSMHPQLIAFSNKNFYKNKLKAFQSLDMKESPIVDHFINGALYTDRKNKVEADAIVTKIASEIDGTLKIGIVAFSEVQLQLIYDSLDSTTKSKLELRIENNTAFMHSLENVQGDECDLLFISMGYGFNNDGKFEMRFGPINMHGGHKRLNVLFSRAKQQIHFFSSVRLKDFSKSENKGVTTLMKWFKLMSSDAEIVKPEKEITFDSIVDTASGFNDLLTFVNIYEERGYKINL